MYMTLYASGLRWEPKGSSCYTHCHTNAAQLTWKPDLQDLDLKPLYISPASRRMLGY